MKRPSTAPPQLPIALSSSSPCPSFSPSPATAGPWQASGFKVGEVSDTEAIVWTRLTKNEERVHKPGVLPIIYYRDSKTKELLLKAQGRSQGLDCREHRQQPLQQ